MMDQVTILHTIGGDDTNTQAAKIAEYLEGHNYPVTVVGMPKTIDNDVVPIKQSSLGVDGGGRGGREVLCERRE